MSKDKDYIKSMKCHIKECELLIEELNQGIKFHTNMKHIHAKRAKIDEEQLKIESNRLFEAKQILDKYESK